MEHEVVVPLPAPLVRQALQDPALLARCVPGLSTEAGTEAGTDAGAAGTAHLDAVGGHAEVGGRLRVRIGGSTITYRGVLSLIAGREGVLTALAEGQEARGEGEATATVRVSVEARGEGTVIAFTCDLSATGRLSELDTGARAAAGRRLLDRFAADLAAAAGDAEPPSATVVYLDDRAGGDLDDDLADLIAFSDGDSFAAPEIPDTPADLDYEFQPESMSADPSLDGPIRRSIVGRSAEEVDHAPPRGRYAPALPARSARARAATRWGGAEAAPLGGSPMVDRATMPWVIGGGVALLGGAVVLVRALRRR